MGPRGKKSAGKRDKKEEVRYPVFLVCAERCDEDDAFWKGVFESLAYGIPPFHTYITRDSLRCIKGGAYHAYHFDFGKSPDEIREEVRRVLEEHVDVVSDRDAYARRQRFYARHEMCRKAFREYGEDEPESDGEGSDEDSPSCPSDSGEEEEGESEEASDSDSPSPLPKKKEGVVGSEKSEDVGETEAEARRYVAALHRRKNVAQHMLERYSLRVSRAVSTPATSPSASTPTDFARALSNAIGVSMLTKSLSQSDVRYSCGEVSGIDSIEVSAADREVKFLH